MNEVALGLWVSNYKCFMLPEPQGLPELRRVNILIGRNNCGKSSLIEVLEHAVNSGGAAEPWPDKQNPARLRIRQVLTEDDLKKAFQPNSSEGPIRGNHWEYGKRWVGRPVTYDMVGPQKTFVQVAPAFEFNGHDSFEKNVVAKITSAWAAFRLFHLRAERDVKPEESRESTQIGSDGRGLANLVQQFLTVKGWQRDLVNRAILDGLNEIYRPDTAFDEITVLRSEATSAAWEIHLREEGHKDLFPLSAVGSGLKAILLVLAFLYLVPKVERCEPQQCMFAFEELENNLHPAALRRLMAYVRSFVATNESHCFLTTHSNVVIDLFAGDPEAQILHIVRSNDGSTCTAVADFTRAGAVLDDLGLRASDLLQANCLVWVEGPSDRVYLNRWLELYTSGQLKEGVHYQCVFYGGRLLSHLTGAVSADNTQDWIGVLRVNRHAILVMDSDRASEEDRLNDTKLRVISELEEVTACAWVTQGREIENYLDAELLERVHAVDDLEPVGAYEDFATYLARAVDKRLVSTFRADKVSYARQVCATMQAEDVRRNPPLLQMLEVVCAYIRRWNGLSCDV